MGRFAVAVQVEQVDVVAARGDVIHPRQSIELEVESGMRRIGGAVHEQHRALGTEWVEVGRPLVAHENLDAGIVRRHHELFRGKRRSGGD